MGSTENFWKPHSIKSGRDQPGNPTADGENSASDSPGLAFRKRDLAQKLQLRDGGAGAEKLIESAQTALQRQKDVAAGRPVSGGTDTPETIRNKAKVANRDTELYGKK